MSTTGPSTQSLGILLKALRLPSFGQYYDEMAVRAEKNGWTYGQFLHQLADLEVEERNQRKISRNLAASNLPKDKTMESLSMDRYGAKIKAAIPRLCQGDFIERGENVLVFGPPGVGKTHILSAVGRELVFAGKSVFFIAGCKLVERLLAAKQDLRLEKELRILDRYDVVIIDDIGYVQHDRKEMDVLFMFFSERYERKSLMISSNLIFSQWDKIFKDAITTAAAIDRLVHHSTILEVAGKSYRVDNAKMQMNGEK